MQVRADGFMQLSMCGGCLYKDMSERVKRESGVNPERCSHCVRESLLLPLGNREGAKDDDRSQETCLRVEF